MRLRFVPIWFGTKGVEFDVMYLGLSYEANLEMVSCTSEPMTMSSASHVRPVLCAMAGGPQTRIFQQLRDGLFCPHLFLDETNGFQVNGIRISVSNASWLHSWFRNNTTFD